MLIFLFLIITEVLTIKTLKDSLYRKSRGFYFTAVIIHILLSLWLWIIVIKALTYKGFFDNPDHIALLMNLAGLVCAVVVPRIILIVFHFTGKLAGIKRGRHLPWLTNTGMAFGFLIIIILASSAFYGRFNFRTEKTEIRIKGLNRDLDGLKIVQISDLHLASFHGHGDLLGNVMDRVNALNPDLLFNTGDFITYGWREFDANDTILSGAKSRYGNFAVMGNHDFGTYHPYFTEADRNDNVQIVSNLIRSSGYHLLMDTSAVVKIRGARIGLVGIITKGSHPNIIHGDMGKAMSGLDSVDLKILLSHDPNQWEKAVVSKTDMDITFSGHTHGMQMGICTKKFRWSPAEYFYPHWNGLYSEGKQVQYVNRGLGDLAIPFRIWMPPEITLITLKRE